MARTYFNDIIRIRQVTQVFKPSQEVYSMIKSPRGAGLIICMTENRPDYENNIMLMENLLRALYFSVQPTRLNPTKIDMWKSICDFAKHCHNRGYMWNEESMALIIMSHATTESSLFYGTSGSIRSSDGKLIKIKDILKLFHASKCSGMANKPKIFIFQCCIDDNMDFKPDTETEVDNLKKCISGIDEKEVLDRKEQDGFPLENGDIFSVFSREYISSRDTNRNSRSIFVKELEKVFNIYGHNHHIQNIFTFLNRFISNGNINEGVSQEFTLCKQLYFNPRYPACVCEYFSEFCNKCIHNSQNEEGEKNSEKPETENKVTELEHKGRNMGADSLDLRLFEKNIR